MALAVLAAMGLAACKKEASGGMPPASEWKPPAPKPSSVEGGRRGKHTARGSASHSLAADRQDPHAGIDDLEDEEEEGTPEGAGEAADEADENAHGDDEDQMAPRQTLARGQIRAGGDAAGVLKQGSVVYVSAMPVDAAGKPNGNAVAVARLEVSSLPMPFELEGARFSGDVIISAWTDADGEARTREPGDAEGHVKSHLPAEGIDLLVDSVVK